MSCMGAGSWGGLRFPSIARTRDALKCDSHRSNIRYPDITPALEIYEILQSTTKHHVYNYRSSISEETYVKLMLWSALLLLRQGSISRDQSPSI
jgi:hypothetical protein